MTGGDFQPFLASMVKNILSKKQRITDLEKENNSLRKKIAEQDEQIRSLKIKTGEPPCSSQLATIEAPSPETNPQDKLCVLEMPGAVLAIVQSCKKE